MTCPYILQVFFSKAEDVPQWPPIDEDDPDDSTDVFFGLPLWKPRGKIVCMWAVDYITCNDERWVMFGPYETEDLARQAFFAAFSKILHVTRGFRLHPEHCFLYKHKKLPQRVWTDG